MRERPPTRLVATISIALLALPIASALGLGETGGWRMFTRLPTLHLVLEAERADGGSERIDPESLRPHLRRDAERIVVPAMARGTSGDSADGALRAALPGLAELGCALDPTRVRVTARLLSTLGDASRSDEVRRECAR